jgi:hypothetical protein
MTHTTPLQANERSNAMRKKATIPAPERPIAGAINASQGALLAATIAVVDGVPLVAPEPAAALSGLLRATAVNPCYRREPVKSANAERPTHQHVIGRGAPADDGGRTFVRLLGLIRQEAEPRRAEPGS